MPGISTNFEGVSAADICKHRVSRPATSSQLKAGVKVHLQPDGGLAAAPSAKYDICRLQGEGMPHCQGADGVSVKGDKVHASGLWSRSAELGEAPTSEGWNLARSECTYRDCTHKDSVEVFIRQIPFHESSGRCFTYCKSGISTLTDPSRSVFSAVLSTNGFLAKPNCLSRSGEGIMADVTIDVYFAYASTAAYRLTQAASSRGLGKCIPVKYHIASSRWSLHWNQQAAWRVSRPCLTDLLLIWALRTAVCKPRCGL